MKEEYRILACAKHSPSCFPHVSWALGWPQNIVWGSAHEQKHDRTMSSCGIGLVMCQKDTLDELKNLISEMSSHCVLHNHSASCYQIRSCFQILVESCSLEGKMKDHDKVLELILHVLSRGAIHRYKGAVAELVNINHHATSLATQRLRVFACRSCKPCCFSTRIAMAADLILGVSSKTSYHGGSNQCRNHLDDGRLWGSIFSTIANTQTIA